MPETPEQIIARLRGELAQVKARYAQLFGDPDSISAGGPRTSPPRAHHRLCRSRNQNHALRTELEFQIRMLEGGIESMKVAMENSS